MKRIAYGVLYDTKRSTKLWETSSHQLNAIGGDTEITETLWRGNYSGAYFLTYSYTHPILGRKLTYVLPLDRVIGSEDSETCVESIDCAKHTVCGGVIFKSLEWAKKNDMPTDLMIKLFDGRGLKEA